MFWSDWNGAGVMGGYVGDRIRDGDGGGTGGGSDCMGCCTSRGSPIGGSTDGVLREGFDGWGFTGGVLRMGVQG